MGGAFGHRGAIDDGEEPSVPSAMLEYHVTEFSRMIANDAMDVHGGTGICRGPGMNTSSA